MITFHADNTSLCVRGHAKTAPKGEDLICCAVSTIVYSLVANLERYKEKGIIKDYTFEESDGYANIKTEPCRTVIDLFDYANCSLIALSKQYSDIIKSI